jgi:hypothetical protein
LREQDEGSEFSYPQSGCSDADAAHATVPFVIRGAASGILLVVYETFVQADAGTDSALVGAAQVVSAIAASLAAVFAGWAAWASWRTARLMQAEHRDARLRAEHQQLIDAEHHLARLRAMVEEQAAYGSAEYLQQRAALAAVLAATSRSLPQTRKVVAELDRPSASEWSAATQEVRELVEASRAALNRLADSSPPLR